MPSLTDATLDELVAEICNRDGVSKCSWGDMGILVILPKVIPKPQFQCVLPPSLTPDDITDSELFMEEQEGRLK